MWTFVGSALSAYRARHPGGEARACVTGLAVRQARRRTEPRRRFPRVPVFTTRDGVRFRVETVLSDLEIPWSLAFAPDGRLFVTERPGRVRIVNLSTFTSELALTLSGVYAQGEAGLLGTGPRSRLRAKQFRVSLLLRPVGRRRRQPDRTLS